MPDIVYVLTNPAMPGFVKIGYTTQDDVQARMKQLHTTGVPKPFECAMAKQVRTGKGRDLEKALHTAFDPYRNVSREFFEIAPAQVLAILRIWPGKDVTPKGNKQVKKRRTPRPPLSGKKEAYRVFFQGLIDRLREEYQFTGAKKAQSQNWYPFASGFSGLRYGVIFPQEKGVRVHLWIGKRDQNEILFDALREQQEAIESELQESIEWHRMEGHKSCRIAVIRPGAITDNPEMLKEIQDWMIDRLLKFKQVFGPRLKTLVRDL